MRVFCLNKSQDFINGLFDRLKRINHEKNPRISLILVYSKIAQLKIIGKSKLVGIISYLWQP